MKLLEHLLRADAAAPRLTVYNEATGARMDFSAQTLDNWAAKIANFLEQELDLQEGDTIVINLPVSWQAAVIALGATAARVRYEFSNEPKNAQAFFTSLVEPRGDVDVVAVMDDPFGRGIAELGGTVPVGIIDFGPAVRFYGDQYFGASPSLAQKGPAERLLSTGWSDKESFLHAVIDPLAQGGSAVVVAGLATAERLEEIAHSERVSARL